MQEMQVNKCLQTLVVVLGRCEVVWRESVLKGQAIINYVVKLTAKFPAQSLKSEQEPSFDKYL